MGVKTSTILENVNKQNKSKLFCYLKCSHIFFGIKHFPFRDQKTVIKVDGNRDRNFCVDIGKLERLISIYNVDTVQFEDYCMTIT